MTSSRAGRPSPWRLAISCFVVIVAASCGPTDTADATYFDQTTSAAQSGSAATGTKVYVGLANLDIHHGDEVTFESIETSLPGVRALVAPLRETDAAIGMASQDELSPSDLAPYRDLAGTSFSSDDGPIGILIEVTKPPDQVDIASPVLAFAVNGGAVQRERLLMAVRICSAPNASDPCPAPDPPAIQ